MLQDLPTIFGWYFVIFFIGIIFFPLTKRLFAHFFDRGYAFSKVLGILLTSYTVWLLASLKIAPFSQITIYLVITILFVINYFLQIRTVLLKKGQSFKNFKNYRICIFEELLFLFALLFWSWIRGHEPSIHGLEKFMDFGFINSILNSQFFPPHDMWLAPANPNINQYSGGSFINYYYYGHYVTAFLTKLTGILPEITYNLMLSTVFGLCFSASFSIGANLIFLYKKSAQGIKFMLAGFHAQALIGGLLTAALVTLGGNLHAIYLFTSGYPNENPVPFWQILKLGFNLTYWYPNATRFIPNTIHEFPSYSWIVADLHGHVLDIPFVLLTIAILLAYITKSQILNPKSQINSKHKASNSKQPVFNLKFRISNLFGALNLEFRILLLLGLLTAVMYMTNAWDGIIYLGLTGLVILVSFLYHQPQTDKEQKYQISNIKYQNYSEKLKNYSLFFVIVQCSLLIVSFFLASLPFNLKFQPFVHGIGVVGGWEIANTLGLINNTASQTIQAGSQEVVKIGPFLLEQNNNLRSPFWMLAVLWGFFYVNVIVFLIRTVLLLKGLSFKEKIRNLNSSDVFVLLMILISTGLLVFPEFFYMKDIYPAHYRANTMFKLGYQAFIMLSIVSAYIIVLFGRDIKYQISKTCPKCFAYRSRRVKYTNQKSKIFYILYVFFIFDILFLILVSIYPYFGMQSYYGVFSQYPRKYEGQDGLQWLKNTHLGDYEAVLWFRNNILNPKPYPLPTILEAVGDSYTDYARISANSGLPTVLGWPVHEWLWRGSYDEPGKRVEEVRQIYEAENQNTALSLLEKFDIKYVIIGNLEREKYKNLKEDFFEKKGKVVFSSNGTKIYKIF